MSSTHNELLNTIKNNLDKLTNVELDFLNSTQNSELLDSFYNTFDLISKLIKDTSNEDALLNEFVSYRKQISNVFNKKLKDGNLQCKELEKTLETERKVNMDTLNRLKNNQNNYKPEDLEKLIGKQEMLDRLNQWQHSCELENIEIRELKCNIDILNEKIDSYNYNSNQLRHQNRLLYEFLSAALKLTILSIDDDGNANLAVLSESKISSEQTWHRFSSSKDSDVSTSDFLWNLIERSLSSNSSKLPLDSNTPKINSLQLSSN